ncbi:DUF1080 domain-containing protein [Porifericola rhodea]|uniref:3-keto-disaccharide hydrolase n=1 Tax=Porifericola rhodea TaxID=930972 RepID=UPI002665F064|nr:DUF1080 domain-containing protein [Porifericola rhodea]WKN33923.1 DUF1080 domain-containing protein [Porifericola rhodea]
MAQEKVKEDWKPEDTEFWDPEVKKVTPGKGSEAPSDAIVLFDGSDLSKWKSQKDGGKAPWTVENGYFTVKPGTGGIQTKENFGDFQLHIEWRSPQKVEGEGQGRGNSGIFLQGMYEVQVLDSYDNRTYRNGQAGSIYKQSPPLVNAMRPVDEWEVYDIIYTAPRFDEKNGAMLEKAQVTVLHNGIVVQNATTIHGTTEYIGPPKVKLHGKGPISLQDHSNEVSFRNIWIRELN